MEELARKVARRFKAQPKASPLDALPAPKRRAFEQVIALIYECSGNKAAAAKLLVNNHRTSKINAERPQIAGVRVRARWDR